MGKIGKLSKDRAVLIAGPTASGKSGLALQLAERDGGIIINADAMQVYSNWRILTARPDGADLARAPHHLYGHAAGDTAYSVGQWLTDIRPLLEGPERVIIVGGTGLYFTALTEGLADIPPTPPDIRTAADQMLAEQGLAVMLADLDPETLARIDQQNPVRVQRAWEVQATTGHGLAALQDQTPAPLLPLENAETILLSCDKDQLNKRIAARFEQMLAGGVLDEARDNLSTYAPTLPSAKAIGAAALMLYLRGELSLDRLRDSVCLATRQYAKRQRSWFRARMAGWNHVTPD